MELNDQFSAKSLHELYFFVIFWHIAAMLLSSFPAAVFLFLSSLGSVASLPPNRPVKDCPAITITYTTTAKQPGLFSLEFIVSGGKEPYKYIFYEESGKLVSEEFNQSSFSSVKAGNYQLTVIDSKNCRETKSIQLKWRNGYQLSFLLPCLSFVLLKVQLRFSRTPKTDYKLKLQ